jgi:hypothetical protein
MGMAISSPSLSCGLNSGFSRHGYGAVLFGWRHPFKGRNSTCPSFLENREILSTTDRPAFNNIF